MILLPMLQGIELLADAVVTAAGERAVHRKAAWEYPYDASMCA